MIAIIDYGVGNIFSLSSSFKSLGADILLTNDANTIKKADKIVLPGVGAYKDAAEKLRSSGMFDLVRDEALNGKPLLGICLGMQLLLNKSYEFGECDGLGLINGSVKPIENYIDKGLKIPHIGWNYLKFPKKNELFKYINEGDYVYFVHSFHGTDCEDDTIATTQYGGTLTAAVARKNIYGTQFHPEKSGTVGMKILQAFIDI